MRLLLLCGGGTHPIPPFFLGWPPPPSEIVRKPKVHIVAKMQQRGREVHLVNARHTRNLPGRKSDIAECQWLLKPSPFRPSAHKLGIQIAHRPSERLARKLASRFSCWRAGGQIGRA